MNSRRVLPSSVAGELRLRLDRGEYKPGGRLPSEPALAASLGVSRPTLREAIALLIAEGWLVRRHGSGTYVAHHPPLPQSLDVNHGIRALISQSGREVETVDVQYSVIPACHELSSRLGVNTGHPIEVLDRVRTADGRRVVHSLDHVPSGILPAGSVAHPLASLHELMLRAGRPVVHGEARLQAVAATTKVARALRVGRGSPIMRIAQVDIDISGIAVVYSVAHYLPDAFEMTLRRRGPHSG